MVQKILGSKKFRPKTFLGPKNIYVKRSLVQKNVILKKLASKKVGFKTFGQNQGKNRVSNSCDIADMDRTYDAWTNVTMTVGIC